MQAGYPDVFVIASKQAVHFGVGAVGQLPAVVRAAGADHVVVVTDAVLAATPVIATVMAVLADAGLPARLFSGVHPNPTTVDIAAGAEAVAESAAEAAAAASASASAAAVTAMLKASAPSAGLAPAAARIALVAVGGGSPMDAAKGIAIAAVNPQRGPDLDYRGDFVVPALPIVAVPTTAGTGAETSAFGVVTDPAAQRKVYVGHASSMPAAAILDPALTAGLPPAATAATGMDALTHALESYLSIRANPWSDGIALQVVRMIAASLPRACADGTDREARAQMLLAAHMAGIGMAGTGLGICHAIAHALGGRFDIPHGVALTMVLPPVLSFNLPPCQERMADIAVALGVGDSGRPAGWNSRAVIDYVTALRERIGMSHTMAGFGITAEDYDQIAADALDDEVLANTPRRPEAADISAILLASQRAS